MKLARSTIRDGVAIAFRAVGYSTLSVLSSYVFGAIALYVAGRLILPEVGLAAPALRTWLLASLAFGVLTAFGDWLAEKFEDYRDEEKALYQKTVGPTKEG